MAGSAYKKAKILDGKGIGQQILANQGEPLSSLCRLRNPVAESTAQIAVFFHSIQIVAVAADSPHPGDGFAVIIRDADHQIIGNGKDFRLHTVGSHNTLDTFFHPEGFGTGHGQLVTEICRHIQ